MFFTPRRGQFDLAAAFLETGPTLRREPVITAWTGDVFFKPGCPAVLFGKGHTAGGTEFVTAFAQVVIHRYAVVKHETITSPQACIRRHLFQVIEYPAFEVINIPVPELL